MGRLLSRVINSCPGIFGCFYIFMILLSAGCNSDKKGNQFVIGFSQCVESDNWRKTMLNGMKRELAFYPNVDFIYKQADGNSKKQIRQVRELMQEDIDLLIISPNEAKPLTPVVEEAFNKGIPVLVVDRKIASSLYTAYVGANNYEIGKLAGDYIVSLLKGKGNLIEVTGLPASSPAIERHKGFIDAISKYDSIKVIDQVNGQWMKDSAVAAVRRIAPELSKADLIYAHNDMMALGTYEVAKGNDRNSKLRIIGVDGLPGPAGGIEFVSDKLLTATLLYPTGGEEAIRIAMQILNKENFLKENILKTSVVDSTNVYLIKLQTEKINSQQKDIERQQVMISEQQRIYKNQRTFLYVLVTTLLIAVSLGGIVFYSLSENRKINRKLEAQNQEISNQRNQLIDQRNQLIEMSAKAQAANEAKFNFFTNISHEFRTPLTLILGPLEELLADTKLNYRTSRSLVLVQKNVIRLLRLVNQLMDFRKIEHEKMQLKASENDLVNFAKEILDAYKEIARKRNIDLRLITREPYLNLWFDVTMLDKVLFNLLSNAFKFTKDNGYVHVYIDKDEASTQAVISVQDNGVGMSKESLNHSFEIFYQGESENYKGSGLGLALSRELIQIHHGSINVSSEKWKGTTFEIRLPLGNAHLQPQELIEKKDEKALLYEDEKIYTTDLQPEELHKKDLLPPITVEKEHSVLIIEDNPDLRNFLSSRLNDKYEILQADNSNSALQQAFDVVPDLILCDVVIPGKDGMALTNIFKTDIRTSHIPVILLTAKIGIEEQIQGMKNMADAYITKPFNLQVLEETIKSLLTNRAKLKLHFSGELTSEIRSHISNKLDRKFLTEFTAMVESNISNENLSVEELCKNMGISRVQLYRKIKALLNCNVNDYILNTRMQRARYLLQNEDLTISEVSFKTGFSSPAYFSTVFKSKFGITPSDLKRQKQ
jgi:signal transduction histidine kinase/DNA-binding response OmpR family regulator